MVDRCYWISTTSLPLSKDNDYFSYDFEKELRLELYLSLFQIEYLGFLYVAIWGHHFEIFHQLYEGYLGLKTCHFQHLN